MQDLGSLGKVLDFLRRLEEAHIWYNLKSVRVALMVEVFIPGERWEIEFFDDGSVEIERFVSTGVMLVEQDLDDLIAAMKQEDYPDETPEDTARRRASYYYQH
jgi:hypothetical protein